jgi:hypothetical protein
MDKQNENRKRRTKGKVATERVQMGRSRGKKEKKKGRATGRIITEVKLGIKEKRPEKGEGCMKRKVHIANKWWKIMTIYSKEIKTTRRRVEDAMKENREDRIVLGEDFNGRIRERGVRNWEEERGMGKGNRRTRWKLQRGRD